MLCLMAATDCDAKLSDELTLPITRIMANEEKELPSICRDRRLCYNLMHDFQARQGEGQHYIAFAGAEHP
jgi:hypothetical protein